MPLRVAFVSSYDVTDVRAWSGIPYHVSQAFLAAGVHLEMVSPLQRRVGPGVVASRVVNKALGRHHVLDLDRRVQHGYARQVAEKLRGMAVDAVFSIGAIPIAYLETDLPVVYWGDATFDCLHGYYPGFDGISVANVRDGTALDAAAMAVADAAVFASSWAAESARATGAAQSARAASTASGASVHEVPFGANLMCAPDRSVVEANIAARSGDRCRLLFLGVEWHRKGGDRALALASALDAGGVPTVLTVAGPPRRDVPESPLIRYVGFIDKGTAQGEAEIRRLLAESHFLCLPSRAECAGCVLCEANACGVPNLACRTGGVGSLVSHGVNGYLFDEGSFAQDAASAVAACLADLDDTYRSLALRAHDEYLTRLNWRTSTTRVIGILEALAA